MGPDHTNEMYFGGADRRPWAKFLLYSAERILRSSEACRYWEPLSVLVEHAKVAKNVPVTFAIYSLVGDKYTYLVDDAIFIAAFEMMGKASLLTRGIVVHEITAPEALRKEQKRRPVPLQKLKRLRLAGEDVQIDWKKTIQVSTVLKPRYANLIGIPDAHLGSLCEMIGRRNALHYHTVSGHHHNGGYFETVGWLMAEIKRKRRRLPKP